MGSRVLEGTFLGLKRGSAAYRVLVNGREYVSRDVTFNEAVRGPASRQPGTPFDAPAASPSPSGGSGGGGGGDGGGGGGGGAGGCASGDGDGGGGSAAAPHRPATRSQHQPLTPPWPALSRVQEWRAAMDEETVSLAAHGTWELVPLPPGQRALPCRWVYTIKKAADGATSSRLQRRLSLSGCSSSLGS
ncbi:hypothetical protein TSOC_009984 [Tetrabaena socialis]|uniref:Retroviral polymerase SH3-like domain-containing protein n=1 Tax=Tetrabaena socialis TaxID=47790 RepID=A0A2J7ZUF8_9CHLO|nr:hypothetical protein TSOC_009984 [Tetrabaena socialis]|eukprot:PNH03904.1 hypothetical protein TSOC_009984 [Tetrabaena socialis]